MARVIACVDGSSYAAGVCDHAAWFAGRLDARLRVLHVRETGDSAAGEIAVDKAVARLAEEGAEAEPLVVEGGFADMVAAQLADLVVMGKRGAASEGERRLLGSNVETVIAATTAPVCLSSLHFLPIRRALVLLDADMAHRRAVEFVASHPGMNDLATDLVVAAGPGQSAADKLEWARSALAARSSEVFAVQAANLDDAVARYRASRSADLVVVSRPVLFPELRRRRRRIDLDGMWGFRSPVLVC